MAQIQGYKNMVSRRPTDKPATQWISPRVRQPDGGLTREKKLDRELYRKRQAAGGGIPPGSLTSQERNWNETLSSLLTTRQ